MRTSTTTGELVKALALAKASIKPPKKTHVGKVSGTSKRSGREYDYEYRYADRADVIEASVGALAAQGLVITHATDLVEGTLYLSSRLSHSSGEWMESTLPIPASATHDSQILGGFLTYYERYQSNALLDMAAEDDDDGARAVVAPKNEDPPDPTSLPFHDLRLAIEEAAKELEQRGGGLWPEHVRQASSFTKDEGGKTKTFGFSDPYARNVTEKWAKSTLSKLTAKLAETEPGEEKLPF